MDTDNNQKNSTSKRRPYCETSLPDGELRIVVEVTDDAADDDDNNCGESVTETGAITDSYHTHNTADAITTISHQERERALLSMENGAPPNDIVIQQTAQTNYTTTTDTAGAIIESRREQWERRKIVTLYLVTITVLFADMNLLAPNLSIIADEFGMLSGDERDIKLGGLLALGFFLVGAPVSFIVGWLADSMNRSPLFAATVFFGEIGSLMVMFVRNYWQLYICRYVHRRKWYFFLLSKMIHHTFSNDRVGAHNPIPPKISKHRVMK